VTPYKNPSDYVWTTDANRAGARRGKQPVWLSTVMRDYIQPAARKVGSIKKMSWHTFRHTFSTLLKGNGEDVKVVQEVLGHSTAKDDPGHLHAGSQSAEACGTEQSGQHDLAKPKLYPSLYREFLVKSRCLAITTRSSLFSPFHGG
jgi:hypothetical protein